MNRLLAVYIDADKNSPEEVLDLCRKAKETGYNGCVLWKSSHQALEEDADLKQRAQSMSHALKEMAFRLWVQTANTGRRVQEALGPHVMEKGVKKDDAICCLVEPEVLKLWGKWATRLGEWYPGVEGVLLSYDEMRAMGTHRACLRRSGYGPLLSYHLRQAVNLHKELLPGVKIGVWSDMFSPYENAHSGSYKGSDWVVKGGWSGSWVGMDKDLLIFNWSYDPKSFEHFSNMKNEQVLCGFYDFKNNSYGDGKDPQDEKALMTVTKTVSYMYTTWKNDFSKLDDYVPR